MATFAERYGSWAVVAGASEGLGEALARGCADRGLNVVLIARRVELAQQLADDIAAAYRRADARVARGPRRPRRPGPYPRRSRRPRRRPPRLQRGVLRRRTVLELRHRHAPQGDRRQRARASCARARFRRTVPGARSRRDHPAVVDGALQGMVRVANYSATKAYNLVLAEGLWAELRDDGVDVLVSCAGATRTPNYVASEPDYAKVPVQEPEQVARETLDALGQEADAVSRARTAVHPLRVPPPDGTSHRCPVDGLCEQPNLQGAGKLQHRRPPLTGALSASL